ALSAIKAFLVPTEYIKRSQLSDFLAKNPPPAIPAFRYPDLLSLWQNSLITAITSFYSSPKSCVDQSNELYIQAQIKRYQPILQGLNDAQAKACVINDDNNLVIAGAGTGKTKTMVHRAQYVIAAGLAQPKELLLIAYGKDAAKEMKTRIMAQIDQPLSVSTFHALGKYIVSQVEKRQRHVFHLATDEKQRKKFIDNVFEDKLAHHHEYKQKVLQYFDQFLFPYKNPFDFKSQGEYFDYIINNEIRPFSGETMRSYEECFIANFLFRSGVRYEYERKYPHASQSIDFKPYQPDFYLPDFDIYIEHFGVDKNERAPQYMNPEKYHEAMIWKREQHKTHGTTLVETFSYERSNKTLITNLSQNLQPMGWFIVRFRQRLICISYENWVLSANFLT
ncbi:MAG: DNA helicase-4, partial [Phenylobacterium sp.]